jgi:DnaJ-class molecular chaperone
MGFITGKKSCWECGGSGRSPRGHGDTSHCGTCDGTGTLKVHRIKVFMEGIKRILHKTTKLFR